MQRKEAAITGALKNVRQELFCLEHIRNSQNGTQAAIAAGYSERSAGQIAARLLKNDNIRARLEELKAELKAEAIADAQEVLEALTRILRREEMEQQVVVLSNRTPTVEANGKTKYTTTQEAAIVDIKPPIASVNKAAELLGRHHALFADRVALEGAVPVTIVNDIPRLPSELKAGDPDAAD